MKRFKVLNAFRHQRFDTILGDDNNPTLKRCSTPFGIRDSTQPNQLDCFSQQYVLNAFRHQRFDTRIHPRCKFAQLVLNAFRHQRFDTIALRYRIANWEQCSTPFGIRDSTRSFSYTRINSNACSTPFGIRDSTLSDILATREDTTSAQRLSASEIRHDVIKIKPFFPVRCSTPFGIRDSTRRR